MALEPKTSQGKVHPERQHLISTAQKQRARSRSEYPPATSTNELVHMFLLSGNSSDQRYPRARLAAEAPSRPVIFAETLLCERSQSPVSTPISAVPIAGRSLSSPSGSRTLWSGA